MESTLAFFAVLIIGAAALAADIHMYRRRDGSPAGDAKHPLLRLATVLLVNLSFAMGMSYGMAYLALSILAGAFPQAAVPAFFAVYVAGIAAASLVGCRWFRSASLKTLAALPEEAVEGGAVAKLRFRESFDTLTLISWVLCQAMSVAAIMIAVSGLAYDNAGSNVELLFWAGWVYPFAFVSEYVARLVKKEA